MALRVASLKPQEQGGVRLEDIWQEWFLFYDGQIHPGFVHRFLLSKRGLNTFWRNQGETRDGIPLSALVSGF